MHGAGVPKRGARVVTHENGQVELLIQLLKLSSMISRPMQDGVAEAHGISLNELRIIMCLGGEGALAGHDITAMMAIPPMNVSRALATLLERGWIEAVVDRANRRRKPVQLSSAGWAGYQAMMPTVATVAAELTRGMSRSACETMDRLAQKVITQIEGWPEGAE